MMSGRDLNVNVSPMDPVINCFLQRNCRMDEVKASVGSVFTKQKACNTDLIVVVIPDNPSGVYGK